MSLFGSANFGLPRLKPLPSKRSHVVSVLDIGSTKVVCMIGRLTPRAESQILPGRTHSIEVIGIGHQKSRGVKNGVIADLDAVESVVRLAVDAAERMAGLTIDSLIVNVSAGRLQSDVYTATIDLGGQEVEANDLKKVLAAAGHQSLRTDRAILHSLPTGFSLDGERGIRDPLAMFGDVLGVDMHVLTAERPALKNLELCVNRAHLSVEGMVATPYASGLAALVDDEVELGCAAIDMGGGTTTISVSPKASSSSDAGRAWRPPRHDRSCARPVHRIEDAERLKVVPRFGASEQRGRARYHFRFRRSAKTTAISRRTCALLWFRASFALDRRDAGTHTRRIQRSVSARSSAKRIVLTGEPAS